MKKGLKINLSLDFEDQYYAQRVKFDNEKHFLASVMGFAIGCEMILKFPYIVYQNGGITFLGPYLVIVLILVVPVSYLELALGQVNGDSYASIVRKAHPKLKGFGWIGCFICGSISSFYNLQIAYSVVYLLKLLNQSFLSNVNSLQDASDIFFNDVLQQHEKLTDIFHVRYSIFAAYALSIVAVFFLVKNGLRFSGKVMQVTFIVPIVTMIMLTIYGLTLDGAYDGIYYLMRPDFRNLINPLVWADAAFNLVLQMSVGFGVLTQYASHRQQSGSITKTSFQVPFLTFGLTMVTTTLVFCFLGHASYLLDVPVQDLMMRDWELGFVFFPYVLCQCGRLPLFLYFLTLVFLGIDSMMGFFQTICGTIEDAYLGQVKLGTLEVSSSGLKLVAMLVYLVIGVVFSSQAGYELYHFMELYATHIPFIMFLLFEVFYFCTPFQLKKLDVMMQRNGMAPMPLFVKFCLQYLSHISVITISVFCVISQIQQSITYSWWAVMIGWTISFSPLFFAFKFYRRHRREYSPLPKTLELPLLKG